MKAAIYCRVSTKGQAEDELPIAGQEAECRQYAEERGWEVLNVYQDAGYSGVTDTRPDSISSNRYAYSRLYYRQDQHVRPGV